MPQTKSRAGPTPTVPLGSCMCGEINDSNWLDPTVLNVRLDVPLDELARFWQGLSDASRRAVVKAPSMAELLGRAAVCSHSGGMNPDALVLLMKNMVRCVET